MWARKKLFYFAHQGPIGADAVQARCPQQHTHERKPLEPPWFTKALLSPMLCEEGAPLAEGMSQS